MVWIVPERSSLSRVRCAAPKRRALDSSGPFWRNLTYTSGKGGFGNLMIPASKHLVTSLARPRTRYQAPRHLHSGRGLDVENFRGFQLAGELFLLTSLFIEPDVQRKFEFKNVWLPR